MNQIIVMVLYCVLGFMTAQFGLSIFESMFIIVISGLATAISTFGALDD